MTYRRFRSSYGWNRPHHAGWLGYTTALRLCILATLIAAVVTGC